MKRIILLSLALLLILLAGCFDDNDNKTKTDTGSDAVTDDELQLDAKPVIYLYPETPTEVTVNLDYSGTLLTTYPKYENGWSVYAETDGTLTDKDGNTYTYLFWDGINNTKYDFSEGFIIKGNEAADFFREKLSFMGLAPCEYNEFIVYWLPRVESSEYVLVSFQNEAYTNGAKLDITPKPDSILRVFAAMKLLDEYVEVPEQQLNSFERNGFTVIEWGGSIVK